MSEAASCSGRGVCGPLSGGLHPPDVLKGLPAGGVLTQNGSLVDTETSTVNRCAYTGLGRRRDGS